MDTKVFNWLNTLPEWFRSILDDLGSTEPAAIYWDAWLDKPLPENQNDTAN